MDTRKYPLVKVSERVFFNPKENINGVTCIGWMDYLECGHILRTPQDIIGLRYPEKRRCYKCAKGKIREWK